MATLSDEEAAKVMAAARAYARLTQPELAKLLGPGFSTKTVWRMENGERPIMSEDRARIQRVTGVPLRFLEAGFSAYRPEPASVEDAVDQLAARVASLEERLTLTVRALTDSLSAQTVADLLGDAGTEVARGFVDALEAEGWRVGARTEPASSVPPATGESLVEGNQGTVEVLPQ